MRATTRSIVVSVVCAALVAGGGINVALSWTASPSALTLVCDNPALSLGSAADARFPGSPFPTETAFPPSDPPSDPPSATPSDPPSATPTPVPTCSPSTDPSAEPTDTPEPSGTPTKPEPPEVKPPDCSEPPTKAEIEKVFDGWNAAIQNDADKAADRYHADAVLLSTLKDKFFQGKPDIRTYFVDFIKREPKAELKADSRKIEILGDKAAVDTGLYTFTFGDGKKPESIKARFTFVYKVVDKKCLIISHHSSKLPEG